MFKIKNILLLFTIFFGEEAYSQDFKISGLLANHDDNSALPGATVRLVSLRDTLNIMYITSGIKGEFQFNKLSYGKYKIQITYIGFETYEQEVSTGRKPDIGTLKLKPSATDLGLVEITATAERAEQKEDTTQYIASAYKVSQDATIEDLVKKMPGITVENGTVKAHGEDVKKVLVDGKQFFGDDPAVTLKNLPAELVDKIQVFDKLSDQAAWTGLDDGSGQKTINIVTRNGRNSGQFGKFSAGYGTDGHYMLGANINLFKGQRRITLLGMSNNMNQQNFSSEDVVEGSSGRQQVMGGGRSGGSPSIKLGPQNGIFSTNAIGINYTNSWGSKLSVNTSYFLNSGHNTTNQQINRQYILGAEAIQYYNQISNSKTNNSNHRLNMRLEYFPDSANSFILTPRISLQYNKPNSYSAALTALEPQFTPDNLLNESVKNNSADASGYNLSNDFLYRHKFRKTGRTVSIGLATGLTYRYKDNYVRSISDFYDVSHQQSNDTIQQYGKTLTDGFRISPNLVYTEPVGKYSQLQLNCNFSVSQSSKDKQTYDYSYAQKQYILFDTLMSNFYDNGYMTNQLRIGYLYKNQKININAGIAYQIATLNGNTTFPVIDSTRKSYKTILPNLMFNYKFSKYTNLRITYRASTNSPSISQLQKVIDNSNPLLLSTGNPQLNQEIVNYAMSRLSHSNKEKTVNLFVMMFYQEYQNYIGNATYIASKDTVVFGQTVNRGTQLAMPKNLDGAWNTRLLTTIGFPVNPLKSNLNFNTGLSYNRLPSLINAQTSFSNTLGINLGAVLSSNISKKLDFTITYYINYNLVDNTIQPQLNNNYFYQIGSLQFNWEFWKGFFLQNSVTYKNYNRISKNINDQYTLWNFNLGKIILKNKSAEIKLSCYDILNENKSLNRTVTDTYIEDSNTQVLQQYFLLSFTYNLRNFNGKIPPQ